MYAINKWNETFENADTRKRQRLGWFLCPSGTDSGGYIELMTHGERGIKAYAVFLAICQWSATCLPVVRGLCARSDGRPASIRQIAAKVRMPVEVVADALELLSTTEIGWIVCSEQKTDQQKTNEIDKSAGCLPVSCQLPAGSLPQGEGEGEGEEKGEGEVNMSASSKQTRVEYTEEFETFWKSFPKTRRTKKRETFRKWKVVSRSVQVALLIQKAKEYAVSEKGRSEFAVMPSVWLNSGMWEDDPAAWAGASASKVATNQDFLEWNP